MVDRFRVSEDEPLGTYSQTMLSLIATARTQLVQIGFWSMVILDVDSGGSNNYGYYSMLRIGD